jgi:hypothetical protein
MAPTTKTAWSRSTKTCRCRKIRAIHRVLADRLGDIDRISAALYDPKTDLLKTFVDSSDSVDRPLQHYQAPLSESISLQKIVRTGRPRVDNDLAELADSNRGSSPLPMFSTH